MTSLWKIDLNWALTRNNAIILYTSGKLTMFSTRWCHFQAIWTHVGEVWDQWMCGKTFFLENVDPFSWKFHKVQTKKNIINADILVSWVEFVTVHLPWFILKVLNWLIEYICYTTPLKNQMKFTFFFCFFFKFTAQL